MLFKYIVAVTRIHLAELYKENPKWFEQAKEEYKTALKIVKINFTKINVEVAKVRERYAGIIVTK